MLEFQINICPLCGSKIESYDESWYCLSENNINNSHYKVYDYPVMMIRDQHIHLPPFYIVNTIGPGSFRCNISKNKEIIKTFDKIIPVTSSNQLLKYLEMLILFS